MTQERLNQEMQNCIVENNLRAVKLLLEFGANPNSQTQDGWTLLHDAAMYGRIEIAQALIEAGADLDAQFSSSTIHSDKTPIAIAKMYCHDEMVEMLKQVA
jgi:ankyrin repeat protein